MCLKNLFAPSQTAQRNQQIYETQVANEEKAKQDAEAERQRQTLLQQEADRKSSIATGNTAIDSAFAGFDDGYYGRAQTAYNGAYLPEIDQQHARAKDKLVASLAGRGVLESSVGGAAMADLEKSAADQRAKVASGGIDFANSLRSKVADTKTGLYAQSASAADPNAIGSAATGQATALAQQGSLTPTTPLGDLFGSFLTPFVNASQASQNSAGGLGLRRSTYLADTAGRGSSRTVPS